MSTDGVDTSRRRFLTAAASVVGGVGAVYVAVPFLASMAPSERARAAGAPVEVDISKLEPGQKINVEWRGKPVWVVKRTPEMLGSLSGMDGSPADPTSEAPQQPDYAKNANRSIKPEILVLVGICTHLGCSPTYQAGSGAGRHGCRLEGRFLLPLPRFEIRPRRSRLQRCAGPHQPDRSAAPLCR